MNPTDPSESRSLRSPLRDRYLRHYGIDSVSENVFLNGEIMPQTLKATDRDPLSGWQVYSHPDLSEVVSKVRFLVRSDKAVKALSAMGHKGYTIGDRLHLAKLLPKRQWGCFNSYPLPLKVTPLLAIAFRLTGEIPDPDYIPDTVVSFAAFLVWNEKPQLVRLGVDVYRISHSLQIPQTIESLEQYRSRMRTERSHSPNFHKTRYVHATEATTRIDSLNHDPDLRFRCGLAILDLIPGKNKGSHICKVELRHAASGQIIPIGQLCQVQGKVFFNAPLLSTAKQQSDRIEQAKKAYSVASEAYAAKVAELKSQIKGINAKIEGMQKKLHTLKSGLTTADKIAKLKVKRDLLRQKLADLNAPSIREIESELHKIPSDLIVGLMAILKQLGLQPNHWVRSIPPKSPLNSPKFWGNKFGVVCYLATLEDGTEDPTGVLKFHKDLR